MRRTTNVKSTANRRIREGMPLKNRNNKPTGKRGFSANVDQMELRMLHKAMEACGGKEADDYADVLNGTYRTKAKFSDTVEYWKFSTSERDARLPILGEAYNGTVNIDQGGKVYISLSLDYHSVMNKSIQKIFRRAGFELKVGKEPRTEGGERKEIDDYQWKENREEAPVQEINMEVSIREAAIMFSKLAKILKAANPSYRETLAISGSDEEYYRAKGEIAGDVTVDFEICRDTDGSAYVTGTLLKNEYNNWTAIIAEDDNIADDGEYHETMRGSVEAIVEIFDRMASNYDTYFRPSRVLRDWSRTLDVKNLEKAKSILNNLVDELNAAIDDSNRQLEAEMENEDDELEGWWDNIYIEFKAPEEDEQLMNDNRKKKVAKMQKQKEYDDAHRYESIMRRVKALKESSQWNKEKDPIARAAFDAVFAVLDSNFIDVNDLKYPYDDEMEEEYAAENDAMLKNALQGIYHALEQFIPQVNDIFGPDGLDIIFGDEVYGLGV